MGKYLESEEEKRMNYLKRKLLQWKDNAKKLTKEAAMNKLAKWTENKYKTAIARQNWKDLSNKYDMFVNKTGLFQLKQRLRNWLKLRDLAEKLRNRLTVVGLEQLKEGVEFKKILIMMRQLFENWEERNKFLAKRFFVRKWFMQVKKLKQRDETFDKALGVLDKKLLQDNVSTITEVSQISKILKAVSAARAVDFFTHLRRLWGDWDKIRRRILAIMGKYLESEEEKRMNYLKRKLLQWRDNAKKTTIEIARTKIARWSIERNRIANARQNWKDLSNKYDMFINKTGLFQLKQRLRNWLKLRDMAEKLRTRFTIVGVEQLKEGVEFKKILVLMRTLFENWEERNKFLAKRFFIRKWFMQVKKLKERDATLDKAMGVLDKKTLQDNVNTLTEVSQTSKILKAVSAARAVDFFTNLRRLWGDWDKIRKRILAIMGKYLESEEEKRMNYLKRKLLQWADNAKKVTLEVQRNKVTRWIVDKYKTATARQNWKDLSNKYDMYINKTGLFQLKQRLRNWLKLRDMAEKLRNRFTIVGVEQLKEGVEFKKILVMMRQLFENWEERNKFLAKRFFVRKWFMQVKKLKQRDDTFDKAMGILDKKSLTDNVNALTEASQISKTLKAVTAARAVDFFTHLRRLWGDWDKIRRRILAIMGKYLEGEEEKRMNYLKRKLLQWSDNAKKVTLEVQRNKVTRWISNKYKTAIARQNWIK